MLRAALAMLAAPFLVPGAAPASGLGLLMLERPGCEWCAAWNAEVGAVYDRTAEGRRAPLRRAQIHDPLPEGVTLLRPARYTPTFVLLRDGSEIGRIEGYPGEDFFYGMLG
jgi:hypothetical protein